MKKNYFFVASILLLMLSVLGFSDNLFTDVGQKSNSDPKFIIHGLFCFAWFILLVIQTGFIKKGNYSAHIKLGIAGIIAATGVFITTLYIFVVIYKGWENMSLEVKANRFFMTSFAILVLLGYLNRKKPAQHKRYMYVATLYMLGPILSRAIGNSFLDSMITNDLTFILTFIGIWILFFISLFIYDWIILKKIHPVTYLGFAWFFIVWLLSYIT